MPCILTRFADPECFFIRIRTFFENRLRIRQYFEIWIRPYFEIRVRPEHTDPDPQPWFWLWGQGPSTLESSDESPIFINKVQYYLCLYFYIFLQLKHFRGFHYCSFGFLLLETRCYTIVWDNQNMNKFTGRPRRLGPVYTVTHYIKRVKTSWTVQTTISSSYIHILIPFRRQIWRHSSTPWSYPPGN